MGYQRLLIGAITILTAVSLLVPSGVRAAEGDQSPGQKPPELSAALVSCLKSTLGEAAFQDLITGERAPTDDEFDKGEVCFDTHGAPIHDEGAPKDKPKPQDLKFAPGTESCLKEKLGEDFREQMAAVDNPQASKALRKKTKDCFGKNVVGNQPPPIPDDVKTCVVNAVGQAEADTMFKGNPPEPGSELFKKIESAQCFKNFGPPRGVGHDRPEISAEAQACIEKIMGHGVDDARTEPTEEQKQQIGKECFGGRGPDGQGPPQMPPEVQSCLNEAFGDQLDDLKKGPEFLTEEQKSKAGECFKKHNFNPGGEHGGPGGPGGPNGGPQLSDEARACVEGIMGKLDGPKEPTEEQKQRIGKECFGGQGGPGGPRGPGGPPPGADLPADKRECVERIMGKPTEGQRVEPTEEQKQQIGRECFGNQGGPGGPGGPGPNGEPPRRPDGQPGPKNECVERITGGQPPSDDQQKQINRECFSAQGQPGNPGPGGPPPQGDQRPGNSGPGGPPPGSTSGSQSGQPQPVKNDCADRITGGYPPTEEQRKQIDRECFNR